MKQKPIQKRALELKQIRCPWEKQKMAKEIKNEGIDERIARKLDEMEKNGELVKKDEKKKLVCIFDDETFDRASDLRKWVRKIYGMSATKYIDILTQRVMELEEKGE